MARFSLCCVSALGSGEAQIAATLHAGRPAVVSLRFPGRRPSAYAAVPLEKIPRTSQRSRHCSTRRVWIP